jgi:phosphomevalonate kinase
MAKAKKKSMRNEPEMYDEMKKRCNLSLTQVAINGLDALAKLHGISRRSLWRDLREVSLNAKAKRRYLKSIS